MNNLFTFQGFKLKLLVAALSVVPVTTMAHEDNSAQKFITILDTVGGNERLVELPLPEDGEPLTLPNPSVFQEHSAGFKSATKTITLAPEQETELKLDLSPGQVVVYAWHTDNESLYIDFHGHKPVDETFFVRYQELDEGTKGAGSLSAPFEGHHGWYLMNLVDKPVTITFELAGFYNEIVESDVKSALPY